MECAQVTEEQRLWTETQIQKAKHNAWPSCLASVYLTHFTLYTGSGKPGLIVAWVHGLWGIVITSARHRC